MIDYNLLLNKINYDPVSWMDISYLDRSYPGFLLNERRIINNILVKQLNFPLLTLDKLSSFEKELVISWFYLAGVFNLMACIRFKALLPKFHSKISLNKKTIEFLCVLSDYFKKTVIFKAEPSYKLTTEKITCQAMQEMGNFVSYCSDPVKERLFFLLPISVKDGRINQKANNADFLLLRILCQYVRSRYSI